MKTELCEKQKEWKLAKTWQQDIGKQMAEFKRGRERDGWVRECLGQEVTEKWRSRLSKNYTFCYHLVHGTWGRKVDLGPENINTIFLKYRLYN